MANNMPYIQFYPADWSADTRILSLAARGAWLELIMAMHVRGRTSKIVGTVRRLAGLVGCSEEEFEEVLEELEEYGVADVSRDCHGDVTVTCRRFKKSENEREKAAERKRRERENDSVTVMSRDCHGDVTSEIETLPLKESPQHPQESTPKENLSKREIKEIPKTPLDAADLSVSFSLNHPKDSGEVIAEAEKHGVRISETQAQDFINANSVTAQGETWMFRNTPVRDWRKLMNSRWITNWKRDNGKGGNNASNGNYRSFAGVYDTTNDGSNF